MIAAATEAAAAPSAGRWAPWHVFGDRRIQYGIKLGLAGMLALYVTQVMRLPRPNWSILTVLILMLPKYVGASAVKAIMRALGTIAGALIAIWLVGNYTSTPAIFLPLFFLIVGYATYKLGKFPTSQTAYAYFLVGVTTVAVVTNGVLAPDQVWQIGLDRALEILVGVGSSLLVTALVWPRYARDEFAEVGRKALKTASRLVATQTYSHMEEVPVDVEEMHQEFDIQLFTLRNLLQAGSRESALFSARLSNYESFLLFLIRLFHATLDTRRWSKGETFILDHMHGELDALEKTISEEFGILTEPRHGTEELPRSRLDEAFAAFESRVRELRDQGVFQAAPIAMAIAFAGHFAALRSIHDNLIAIRSTMENGPGSGQPPPETDPRKGHFLPAIDWFWVKMGIKGGLAAVIAVLLLEWINPPGAGSIPFMAWTLSFQGIVFLRAGGTGDLRMIQNGVVASAGLVLLIVLLLLATPLLASYTAMNAALFLVLFAFGFLTARISGITFWMQVALLTTSAFVGLNPQAPVPSQTIIDTFVGIIIGTGLGAAVARLFWPVLPQRVLRDSLLALIAGRRALLCGEAAGAEIQPELTLLSVEALQAAQQMRMPNCSAAEKGRILAFVRTLLAAGTQISGVVSRRDSLPEAARPILRPKLERLDAGFAEALDAFADCLRRGDCRREFPSLEGALSEMSRAVEQIRDSRILTHHKFEAPLRMLDLANRYHATTDSLEECCRLLGSLEIQRYWGDYAL